MKYKLLALDLDGTTLSSHHLILPEVKAAIEKAKDKIQVMITTGRHHTTARPYYVELGLNTPSICCNGTYIYHFPTNDVLIENSIPKSVGEEFLKIAEKENLKLLTYTTDAMLFSKTQPVEFIATLQDWAKDFPETIRPDIQCVDSFQKELQESEYLWKFVIEGDAKHISEFIKHPFIQDNFSSEQSWFNRFDISYKGNTKGTRLKEYIAQQGISAEEVIAIGDNFNDISMIELAGLGVAMAHAADEVKEKADYITAEDNNGKGIVEIIEKFIL